MCFSRGLKYCVAHQGLYPQLDIRCEYIEKLLPGLHQAAGDTFLRHLCWTTFSLKFHPVLRLTDPIVFGVCAGCAAPWEEMVKSAGGHFYG